MIETCTTVAVLCGALSLTVPVAGLPPTTLDGLTETPANTAGGGEALTVRTSLKLYRPSENVTVTSVSVDVGFVSKNAWKPNRFSDWGATKVFEGTMAGWLLVIVMVGPPARERPLRCTPANVCSPPTIGLRPEME